MRAIPANPQPEHLYRYLMDTQLLVEGLRAIAGSVGDERIEFLTGSALDRLLGAIDSGLGDCVECIETMALSSKAGEAIRDGYPIDQGKPL